MAKINRSEKSIQTAVVAYARSKGLLCKKMETGRFGSTGWPDYMFLKLHPKVFFIEFKREGGKLTALQEHSIAQLRRMGFPVWVIRNAETGKACIDLELGDT